MGDFDKNKIIHNLKHYLKTNKTCDKKLWENKKKLFLKKNVHVHVWEEKYYGIIKGHYQLKRYSKLCKLALCRLKKGQRFSTTNNCVL